jgi:hypothetical protein
LVPEIVFVHLDPDLARTEPDPEIQDLIRASAGLNLALDYLPGSITFDPIAETLNGELASAVVWFDAYVTNIDRTPRNPNLLIWHRRLWLIDHGATLYFHHTWNHYLTRTRTPFPAIQDHVLLPFADALPTADAQLSAQLQPEMIHHIIHLIPELWLVTDSPFQSSTEHRQAYIEYLTQRLEPPHAFVEEAIHARSRFL